MSIPKGLIIYKASRYGHPLPNNLKYGYYSNKVISTPTTRETQTKPKIYFHRFQKKFTTGIEFGFDYVEDDEEEDEEDDDFREIDALKIFSAFKNVKKCILNWPSRKAIKISRKLFKTLKQVQKTKIYFHFDLMQSSKFFKSLLLAPRLENLSLFLSQFTLNLDGFKLLMQVIKQASKRRCWPDFKSLNIDFANERNPGISETLQLEKYLEFMKDLKCYEDIYRCTDFHLSFPFLKAPDSEQTEILKEISQIVPSLTEIKISDFSYLSDIFNIFKSHKELEGVSIDTYNKLKKKFDVSPLNDIPTTLKDLTVHIGQKRATIRRLENHIFPRIAAQFHDMGSLEDFKLGLPNLPELKSFVLEVQSEDDTQKFRLSNRLWLEEIFVDIGKKEKLEKLALAFDQLDCDDFSGLLLVLGQSLKELTQLWRLSLAITKSYSVKSKDIIAFCRSISKLNRIQDLQILLLEEDDDNFGEENFDILVEWIAKSFPFLSNLILGFTEFHLSRKSYDCLCQVVHRMKSLNSFKLKISSSDIDEDILQKTLGKNALVEIEFTDSSYSNEQYYI